MYTTDIGSSGEQQVAEELSRLGYKIIERNWKNKFAEIDIVAEKAGVIYFCEVKFRQNNHQGDGLDYITSQKLHHMSRAAEAWVLANNWLNEHCLLAATVDGSGKIVIVEI